MRHTIDFLSAGVLIATLTLATPLRAEDDPPPGGELVFLDVTRRATPPPRVDAALAHTMTLSADALVLEMNSDMPMALRRELWQKLGELIGRAWAGHVPDPSQEASHAFVRLLDESRHGNRAAATGLRFVIDTLVVHAKAEARVVGLETIERALLWLARIGGPQAAAALYALSRDAAVEAARGAAVTLLSALARERDGDRYAQECARLLME